MIGEIQMGEIVETISYRRRVRAAIRFAGIITEAVGILFDNLITTASPFAVG